MREILFCKIVPVSDKHLHLDHVRASRKTIVDPSESFDATLFQIMGQMIFFLFWSFPMSLAMRFSLLNKVFWNWEKVQCTFNDTLVKPTLANPFSFVVLWLVLVWVLLLFCVVCFFLFLLLLWLLLCLLLWLWCVCAVWRGCGSCGLDPLPPDPPPPDPLLWGSGKLCPVQFGPIHVWTKLEGHARIWPNRI